MPSTTPESLASTSWSGDTEETPITNDPENRGFPARTQGGDLIFIVKTIREHQTKVLIDADGNRYVDDNPQGVLVPYSTDEMLDEEAVEGHPIISENTSETPVENGDQVSTEIEAGNPDGSPEAAPADGFQGDATA